MQMQRMQQQSYQVPGDAIISTQSRSSGNYPQVSSGSSYSNRASMNMNNVRGQVSELQSHQFLLQQQQQQQQANQLRQAALNFQSQHQQVQQTQQQQQQLLLQQQQQQQRMQMQLQKQQQMRVAQGFEEYAQLTHHVSNNPPDLYPPTRGNINPNLSSRGLSNLAQQQAQQHQLGLSQQSSSEFNQLNNNNRIQSSQSLSSDHQNQLGGVYNLSSRFSSVGGTNSNFDERYQQQQEMKRGAVHRGVQQGPLGETGSQGGTNQYQSNANFDHDDFDYDRER
jgi:hypothetical protein